MKEYWSCSKEQLMKEFEVSKEGLSEEQVLKIRAKKGENLLQEEKKKSILVVFLSQFLDLLVMILIVAAVVSMFSGNAESSLVIFLVLLMNAVLGTVQHTKAERSLDSLKKLSSPSAKVLRNGRKQEISSYNIITVKFRNSQ